MRWFVEVASLSKGGPTERLTVEAATWQGALAQGRSHAADAAPLASFTIEVLPEGYRATNAIARIRYGVARAGDDAPLTALHGQLPQVAHSSGRTPIARPISYPPPPSAAASLAPSVAPMNGSTYGANENYGAPVSRPPTQSSSGPISSASLTENLVPRKPARTMLAGSGAFVPMPAMSTAPPTDAAQGPTSNRPPPPSASPKTMRPPPASLRSMPMETNGAAEVVPTFEPPPAVDEARGKIFFQRGDDPGAISPLTYREIAVAVAEATSLDRALLVGRTHLADIRRLLDHSHAPSGRLVQLAVFDHIWEGRPRRPPLVTLTWKDWRGAEPHVSYPSASIPAPAPQPVAAPLAQPTAHPPSQRPAAPPSQRPAAAPSQRPAPSVPSVPPTAPAAVMIAHPISVAPPHEQPFVAATMPAHPLDLPPPPPSVFTSAPAMPAAAPVFVPEPPPPSVVSSAPQMNLRAISNGPSVPAVPMAPPTPVAPVTQAQVPPTPLAPVVSAGRPRPDDLMTSLFEVMHDLNFLRDGVEGADFVLDLLRETIPTRSAFFHFYDINTKEFVVVRARAPRTDVVGARIAEAGDLVGDSARAARPIVISDTATFERWSRDRYQRAGVDPKQIVVVPVRHGRRFLGAIELADHVDGAPMGEAEINALTYVAEQVSEFLNDRGVSLQVDAPLMTPMPQLRRG